MEMGNRRNGGNVSFNSRAQCAAKSRNRHHHHDKIDRRISPSTKHYVKKALIANGHAKGIRTHEVEQTMRGEDV